MKDNTIHILDGLMILLLMIVIMIVSCSMREAAGYKAGQIDALIGIIKYETVTNANRTVEWHKIK